MLDLLWLIPALPLLGFLILAVFGGRMPRRMAAVIGVGSVGLSAVTAICVAVSFMASPPPGHAYELVLWRWLSVSGLSPAIGFYLDALSLVMVLVVTIVGFLIHLYSVEYMEHDEGYSRFFAYMNLFVTSMLTLLLANNLLLLYLGWEGVGLCSYLLIGFYYDDPANGRAARKAFVVTRIGDTAMAIGLFMLFEKLGTLNIQDLMHRVAAEWPVGGVLAVTAALLLLGGALGKSAQLPLQTWLPDAMAGPTPVSALIHAATMVTAGVYLIARTHVLFAQAPQVQFTVAVIGALTLLISGFAAMTQSDIKRVLAYSTISQIGYMFLALGVGAWSAAIFHFMTHAFFKALLFLGAGAIIVCLHHEQDMFKMGGLRKQLPVTFWTFLIASASLAALPLVTAGFYSKDMIIAAAWTSADGSKWLWAAGLAGAFVTSIYTFRMVFITFFGKAHNQATHRPTWKIKIPLVTLAVLSIIGGFVEIPKTLGNFPLFSDFLHSALPSMKVLHESLGTEYVLQIIAAVVTLTGIYLAYLFYLQKPKLAEGIMKPGISKLLHRYWFSGWGFDWLYDGLIVKPYVWLADVNRADVVDRIYAAIGWGSKALHVGFSRTQTGRIRWYATGIAFGAVVVIAIVVFA
jgi:NADH-quinone oxidoreductase subunit L